MRKRIVGFKAPQAAFSAAEGLAQRGGDRVDTIDAAAAAPACRGRYARKPVPWQSSTNHHGAVSSAKVADLVETGEVGSPSRRRRRSRSCADARHCVSGGRPPGRPCHRSRNEALGLAQANAVDDRGVVQRVGDDRVLGESSVSKNPPLGRTRRVRMRRPGAEEGGRWWPPSSCAGPACRRWVGRWRDRSRGSQRRVRGLDRRGWQERPR